MKTRLALGFRQAGQSTPQSLCDVVWAPNQYSWTRWSDAKKFTIRKENYGEFYRAFSAAKAVLKETPEALALRRALGPADHYFNPKLVTPRWAKNMEFMGTFGFHDFYSDTSRYARQRAKLVKDYDS